MNSGKNHYIENKRQLRSSLCIGFCTHDPGEDFNGCTNKDCIIHHCTDEDLKRKPLIDFLVLRHRRGR